MDEGLDSAAYWLYAHFLVIDTEVPMQLWCAACGPYKYYMPMPFA